MGRPSTRSKNKKHKHPLDQLDSSLEILRKIHASGEITDGDISQLFNLSKPICQGCRVNNKDNPNCFCGLMPSASGSRKSGIWQKTSDFLQSLGPDPCSELRDSLDSPAGLTNLGATCYANSILQCLYMNSTFRRAVFSIEADVLQRQPVLDQLARLFAQLFASKRSFIDSAPFIKSLELDNGVQQDSHEFLTLLLSLLERCLRSSGNPAVRTVIQALFRGGVSHVTRCSNCGRDSDASSKVEDFYELELNVLGLKNLEESLDDYLRTEELNGENQYLCEFCKVRVDASRSITLRTLPRVLNIQLKRCVFLPKTTTKKKVTSSFSFPQQLNMSRRLSNTTQGDLSYDLSAILIHKGTAVNSGHYVAHIKDEKTGIWWEFDDEHVSRLGDHPFGEGPSGSTGKPIQTDPVKSLSSSKHGPDEAKTDHNDLTPQLSEKFQVNAMFSSSDAYLLMYRLQHANLCNLQRYEAEDNKDEHVEDGFNCSQFIMSLPSFLLGDINSSNESLLQACDKYKSEKEKGLNQISKRKHEVRSILPEAPVQSDDEPFFWISTSWLHHWVDDFIPPAVDNSALQCSHGKVPVTAINFMKRVSAIAWSKLFSKYGGGPELSKNDSCFECLKDAARTLVFGDSYRNRRTSMKEIAESALSGICSDGIYYVSRPWLQQWVKRKITDAPTEADAGPSASIRCPHDGLLPEKAAGAKRLLVPENLWLFLREDALNVKPDDSLGCHSFLKDSAQCSQCQDELSEVACFEDSVREVRNVQRQNHEKLAAGKASALIPYCKYFLLPSSWLAKWRNYVNASGKNLLSSLEPDPLDVTINKLICQHFRLLERPLELVLKRGAIFQKISNTDGLALITEDDWKFFCQEWHCSEERGIAATIYYDDDQQKEARPEEQLNVCEEQLQTADGTNVICTTKKPIIRTFPEVCEDCLGERASSELMQRLNYCNEYISVILIQGKEVPRSVLEASETSFDPCRRISKRSRKTNSGSSINVKVSGSTSIYQLKMMIWESLGIVKENQILCKGLNEIEGEDSTLADCNIFPGDALWVRDSKIHENRDIADEISEQKLESQHVEEGFRGSILTTDFSL
ncbi:hypothetical protein MLD38_017766 [Melastoma candidum]|nr:hypothetical protein MLD38_017766 [Melastoma candidum]